jgi:hypothetical protein
MHAPVFFVAATGIAALIVAKTPQQRIRLFAMHVALAAVFAIAYFGYMRPGPGVARYFGNLENYFSADRPAFWDGSATFFLSQTRIWLWQFFNNTGGLVAVLAVAMVAYLAKVRDRAIAVIALLPIVIVLVASAAHAYPYSEIRLMLFLLPGLSLLSALAVQWLLAQRRVIAAPVAAIVLAVLAVFVMRGVRDDTYNASYMYVDDLRGAYTYLKARWRPGTPVIVREFDARPLRHYVPISSPDIVLLNVSAREAATSAPEYWTFLRTTDRLRVWPQGTVVDEMSDGRMRVTRYRRR